MSVTPKPLINAKYAANSATTEYTVPVSTKTIIDKFTATNINASSQTIKVYLVPSGGSTDDSTLIIKDLSISASETADISKLQNQILAAGDLIRVEASLANAVTIRASGREVT